MTKVAFLDRDGTINVDHGYVFKREDWEWIEGAVEGMRLLQNAGYALTVITNQTGIARGFYSEADMQTLHTYLQQELAKQDVSLAAVAFCPHDPDGTCDCRKPKTGMAIQIEAKIGPIDYAASWTIGDKQADLGFGTTLGTKTALVRSAYWQEEQLTVKPTIIVASLLEAAQYIVK